MATTKSKAPPQVSPDYQRGLQDGMNASIGQAQALVSQPPPKISGPGDRTGHYNLGLWEAAQKLLAEAAQHPAAPVAVAAQQLPQGQPMAAPAPGGPPMPGGPGAGGPQMDPQQLQALMQQFFQPGAQ